MKYVTIALWALIFLSKPAHAQEQLGLRLETYAGVSSLSINPTGNLNNPLKWDLNLVGGGIFFENNYAFLRETSLRRLLKHRNDATFVAAGDVEGPQPGNTFVVDFFNDDFNRFINFNGFVAGPSLALRLGESHSVGIFTNLRSAAGSVDIPTQFSYYKYDARPLLERFQIPTMQAALLNWSEIGLNYALKVPTIEGSMNFGISLKYLQGYEAGYIENQSDYVHTKLPDNTITLDRPDGRYGYAARSTSAVFDGRSGQGLGADLGFAYIFQDHEEDWYKLKLGASLLDVGRLKFNKNAQAHRLQLDSTVTVHLDDYDKFDLPKDIETVIRTLSENALADSLATYEANNFKVALPTAMSLQADFGFTENIYVNALLVQRLPTVTVNAQRGSLLAVTPRWQHRWFSVSAPLSVYNWSRMHVGLAARLGWLVIGSDDLAGVFANKNYTGADFYFALKVNPFEIGGGRERGSGRPRLGRSRVKCYTF